MLVVHGFVIFHNFSNCMNILMSISYQRHKFLMNANKKQMSKAYDKFIIPEHINLIMPLDTQHNQ